MSFNIRDISIVFSLDEDLLGLGLNLGPLSNNGPGKFEGILCSFVRGLSG